MFRTPQQDSTQLWIWNSRNILKMIISNEVETLLNSVDSCLPQNDPCQSRCCYLYLGGGAVAEKPAPGTSAGPEIADGRSTRLYEGLAEPREEPAHREPQPQCPRHHLTRLHSLRSLQTYIPYIQRLELWITLFWYKWFLVQMLAVMGLWWLWGRVKNVRSYYPFVLDQQDSEDILNSWTLPPSPWRLNFWIPQSCKARLDT